MRARSRARIHGRVPVCPVLCAQVTLLGQIPPIEKLDNSLQTLKAVKHLSLSTNSIDKVSCARVGPSRSSRSDGGETSPMSVRAFACMCVRMRARRRCCAPIGAIS